MAIGRVNLGNGSKSKPVKKMRGGGMAKKIGK